MRRNHTDSSHKLIEENQKTSDNKDMRELDMDELVNVIGGEMTPKEKDYITALIRRLKKTAKPKNMSKAY